MENTSNKTIVKNTILLYFRMALVTVVGLYTSRVILQTLGVEDFGIYNVAGSAVALFSFLTSALSQSSSRYITVEIGRQKDNDYDSLIRCFKTTRTIHAILAIIIFIICETVGLIIFNKSSIPPDRIGAAVWVFHISVATALVNIIQLPYNALIIAHEKMGVFAYVSILEVTAKLLICYMLIFSPVDKLIFYAILVLLVQIMVFIIYCRYCYRNFKECKKGYKLSNDFFKPMMTYSFWSLFGGISYSALTQGSTILISFFFGPSIVAARALANQVKGQVINFVNNFRIAINPQIIKRNASGDIASSKGLLFFSANITFYLMLAFVLPLIFEVSFVLKFWLHDVPEYTVEFMQIALLEMLFYVYDVTFFQIFRTEGRLKENAIICPIIDMIGLAIVYIIYLFGGNVLVIGWCMVILTIIEGMIVKPLLAKRLFGYELKDFLKVYANNMKVLLASLVIPTAAYFYLGNSSAKSVFIILLSVLSALLSSFFVGLTKVERSKIKEIVLNKLNKRNGI